MKKRNFVFAAVVAASLMACGGGGEETPENSDSTQTTKTETPAVQAKTITVNKSFTLVRESLVTEPEKVEITVLDIVLPYTDNNVVETEYVPNDEQLVRVDLSIKNLSTEVPYTMSAGEIEMVYKDTVLFTPTVAETFKKQPEYFGDILDLGQTPAGQPVKKALFFRLPAHADLGHVKIQATSHFKGDKTEIVGINVQ